MSIAAVFYIPFDVLDRQRETTFGLCTATARGLGTATALDVELSPPIFDFADFIIIKEYIL